MSSAHADAMVTTARTQLGVHERADASGHHNNDVLYTRAAGVVGQPWCVWFVVWVARTAGLGETIMPRTGSCAAVRRWAVEHDRWTAVPRPGSVALVNAHAGSTRPVHCGIVEGVGPRGRVTLIEGNTNSDGGPEGHTVMRHTRAANRVVGYLRIG
jgi:hypothetical protein